MKKNTALLLTALFLSGSALTSCYLGGENAQKKVALSFGAYFDYEKTYEDDSLYFHNFDQKVEKDGVVTMEKRYIANEMEIQRMIDKKASFLVVAVPDFMCLCWSNFRSNVLVPYIRANNADIYVVKSETLLNNSSWGFQTSGNDPTVAIFSKGKVAFQTVANETNKLATSSSLFNNWVKARTFAPVMLSLKEEQLQSLAASGFGTLSLYFGRSTCADCTYFETNFLFEELEKYANKNVDPLFYIDCDVEGIRYKNGEVDTEQWAAYKRTHLLAETEFNVAGYGPGYVPTLMRIAIEGDSLEKSRVLAYDVYLNDAIEKDANNHCIVTSSYFTEARKEAPYLNYINSVDNGNLTKSVLMGTDLGEYSGEQAGLNAWYKEKAAAYHNAITAKFLENAVF